ncbi:Inactive metallocarboxypeptidase ECM14 [Abortiporus biennis]
MVSSLCILWSLLPAALVHALQTSLEGQEVLNAPFVSAEQNGILRRFRIDNLHERDVTTILDQAENAGADVWQVTHKHMDVFIPRSQQLSRFAPHTYELSYTDTIIPPSSLYPNATQESLKPWNLSSLSNSTFHAGYHQLSDIDRFIVEMADLYPDLVNIVNIGHSAEGREMFALEISKDKTFQMHGNNTGHDLGKKVGFLVTGAQHAREWIATSTALYIAHALVAESSERHSLSSLLNYFNFYIILVPNPDGYVYTWEQDRFWYKSRQNVGPNEKCVGIDMNRNWGHKWKPVAKFPLQVQKKKPQPPTDACSHWYPGHRAFESPEVNFIANYVTTLGGLQAYVDLRSYGQMLSAPFSYSCKQAPKDAENQIEAAMGAARAIKEVHGTVFTTGRLCEMLYRAPGNVVDYMYAKAGIKYSYAAHLRDTGTYGFAIPPEWIRPVGEETVNLVRSLASFISNRKF